MTDCTLNLNITIVPPEGGATTGPLAVAATLFGTSSTGNYGDVVSIRASTLKEILFEALAAFLDTAPPPGEADRQGDDESRGTTPVVLALEAALDPEAAGQVAGPVTSTVIPLVRSSAIRTSVRAVLDRGRDYWIVEAVEVRGGDFIQDGETLDLRTDQPGGAHDVRLVPLHTMPLPSFIVLSTGTR